MLNVCIFKSEHSTKAGAAVLQGPTSNAGNFIAQRRLFVFSFRNSG